MDAPSGRVETAPAPAQSLVGRTLLRVAVRITIVVLIASFIGYHHVRTGMEAQALRNLERYVVERRARESTALEAAEASVGDLAASFGAILDRPTIAAGAPFYAYFTKREDGTWRTYRGFFRDDGVTGFVGKYSPLSAEHRRVLVAASDLLKHVGPALRSQFANVYVITPQNGVVIYWPTQAWGLEAGDWEIFGKLALIRGRTDTEHVFVVGATDAAAIDAAAGPAWSGLYFDYGVNRWVVSVTQPIVRNGRLVASIGHDLLVDDLIERVVTSTIDGTYNVLIDADGRLIAHPHFMQAIQANSGAIDIASADDDLLKRLYALALELGPDGGIADLDDPDLFVASTQLAGPGWYLMTVFPKALIASQASDVAWLIIGLGIAALLVELLVLASILRNQVGAPLNALVRAAEATIRDPTADFELSSRELERRDELGMLARTYQALVDELHDRQATLAANNQELQRLNAALRHELIERERAERELERNRELIALVNTIDYGVLFLNSDLEVRLANEAYLRIWETPPDFHARHRSLREDMEQSYRQGLYALSPQEWPAYLEARLEAVRRGGVGPTELRRSDGRVLMYQCVALPDGGRMLTYFDITELKRAEANLRVHLEGMEASMDGMALLDQEGRYVYVNQAHANVYAFDRDDMIGRSWRELYAPEELSRFEAEIMPTLAKRGQWHGEAIGRRRSGAAFPQELSLAVTENGGLVCVVRDITKRKDQERALDRAVHEAEESNAAKSRFLASMSHELRTPLNAIIGFSRLVARSTTGMIPQRQSENLTKIQASGEHLLKLINDILDISKIEAGRTEVGSAGYSPAAVIHECVQTVEPLLSRHVSVVVDVEDGVGPCTGDETKVRQVLMNLLSNAARHTVEGEIRVALTTSGERLRFAVSDTGGGIPPAAQETIFEEFGQARDGDGRPLGGTGLGLTISRRLARLMGGDLTVVSEPGAGSTFTLDLPRCVPPRPAGDPPPDTATVGPP